MIGAIVRKIFGSLFLGISILLVSTGVYFVFDSLQYRYYYHATQDQRSLMGLQATNTGVIILFLFAFLFFEVFLSLFKIKIKRIILLFTYIGFPIVLFALMKFIFSCQLSNSIPIDYVESNQVGKIALSLKKGVDVNARVSPGRTALMWAAFFHAADSAKYLIEKGADVNAKDGDGYSPLTWAVQREASPDFVKMLIEAGADVNTRDEWGHTPLMVAAKKGAIKTVKLLIENGADFNITANDYTKSTALSLAKESSYPDTELVVKLLAELGAK